MFLLIIIYITLGMYDFRTNEHHPDRDETGTMSGES